MDIHDVAKKNFMKYYLMLEREQKTKEKQEMDRDLFRVSNIQKKS